nr:MAG TPA_asm: hypothetical protein [Caudoviricetes sp.]
MRTMCIFKFYSSLCYERGQPIFLVEKIHHQKSHTDYAAAN